MFKKYSKQHNNGIPLGLIKSSECRMTGEHTTLIRLLRLRNALKATVTSKDFIDLQVFKDASNIVLCDDFWKYLFVLFHALYAPMHVLCLADQKNSAMGKLYFYVLQTDLMLPKWLSELDGRTNTFMNITTRDRMGSVATAGESDKESNDDSDKYSNNDDATKDIVDDNNTDDSTANKDEK
jgi:hypothetical protein